ncbi:hypothetical protein BU24DRAFT_484101 [Aaosphaeria arxii CBS 175.79]|uniref:DUF6546 domain-containing protein n=1 Tax=Aaosphaeria arxii CBS 175.79 TaxID=1450172 RepID=A0A6A5XI21_9PLEO|nr:uncharacterized protein BU24DRAFT_484101 [Aaosphaeria arxii CBS 175.79]KAF2012461.1 hypothetical protein BU24DRAFT_484101 [Aaosphaeria arxii CBS 175.79]
MPKSHNDNAFPWASLPADIRLLILDEISDQKYRGWSVCAAVCKEWQAIIEPKNFCQLALKTSCLDEFEYLVIRQRPLVQHICLNVELPRYACPTCQQDVTVPEVTVPGCTSDIFWKAVLRLFSTLSTWQPAGRLILELNASSPSDSEHWFKNYCFGPGHEDIGDWTQQERAIRWHDPKHGWADGQQIQAPDPSAILRIFSPLCLDVPQNLPVVHAVTGFQIHRQLRHQLFPFVLKALLEKLPRLESMVYELWRVSLIHHQIADTKDAKELANIVEDVLPEHVKEVSIFKDFNDQLELTLDNARSSLYQYLGVPRIITSAVHLALSKAFARKSHNLERLSIAYMIDAQQLFISCRQMPCTWNLLQSLTLTSSILARTASHQSIYALLQDASLTALNMPQLKSMVLWNGGQGQACAVIYQRRTTNGLATLTWRSTWDLELSQDVEESWKKVVPSSCCLLFEKELLRDVDIRSHGDAIHHLRLSDRVIDPTSLRQILQEGRMQRLA